MKKPLYTVLSLLLATVMIFSFSACGQNPASDDGADGNDSRTAAEIAGNILFVSVSGSDESGDGSESNPFATLSAARDAIRKIKTEKGLPEGGITVLIGGGTYNISEAVTFTEEDSGEDGKPITYKAKSGEEVIIDGGHSLKGDDFKPANDTFKARLQTEDAKANVVEIDLAAAGCKNLFCESYYGWGGGIIYKNQQELFFDGKRQNLARWPNGEYAVSEVVSSAEMLWNGETEMTEHRIVIPEGKAALWSNSPICFCGLLYNGWETTTMSIGGSSFDLNVEENYLITRTQKGFIYQCNSGRPFYVYNIPEELDEPGEYYWDKETDILYYYPTSGISGRELYFSQVPDYLIHMTDTSYIAFDSIVFRHSMGSGITSCISEGAEKTTTDITVKNCTFTCLGGTALVIDDTVNTMVDRNVFTEIGCAGIKVTNDTLVDRTPSNNCIQNNLLHDWAQFYPTENPAITARGMGFYIGHNELYDSTHTGINFHCGDSIVEYNIVHDLCKMSGDAGGIYNGGSWAKIGNVVRYNYVYNLVFPYSSLHPNGIYLDDQICGQLCYGNVIRNIGGCGIALSGGKFLTARNNVLIDMSEYPIALNDNGISFQTEAAQYSGDYNSGYWKAISEMDYTNEFIASMYPELLLYLEVGYLASDADDPGAPAYEVVENNVVCGKFNVLETIPEDETYVKPYERFSLDGAIYAGGLTYQNGVVRNNVIYGDGELEFATVGKVADAFTEDSQVYRDLYNFERIPYEKIGIED